VDSLILIPGSRRSRDRLVDTLSPDPHVHTNTDCRWLRLVRICCSSEKFVSRYQFQCQSSAR